MTDNIYVSEDNVLFIRDEETKIKAHMDTHGAVSGGIYVSTDSGKMWVGSRRVNGVLEDGVGENSARMENCQANGSRSVALGNCTIASSDAQIAVGRYNEEVNGALFVVGTGSEGNSKNAMVVSEDNTIIENKLIVNDDAQIGNSIVFTQDEAKITAGIIDCETVVLNGLKAKDSDININVPQFKRTVSGPLDTTSVFSDYASALTYINDDETCYHGQVVTVNDTVYMVCSEGPEQFRLKDIAYNAYYDVFETLGDEYKSITIDGETQEILVRKVIPRGTRSLVSSSDYSSINQIILPDSIKRISDEALKNRPIKTLRLPNSVSTIGMNAFEECTHITNVGIPDSITYIGSEAFKNCEALTNVRISNRLEYIGANAFYGCDILNYNEYYNGLYLGNESNSFLVLIKSKNTDIEECEVHPNTKFIAAEAFANCEMLKTIKIPNGVKSIGDEAFLSCWRLTTITIPSSVTSIGNNAFKSCSGLMSITVDSGNGAYESNENCLIEKSTKTLIWGCKNSKIPTDGSVTSIGEDAFYKCDGLTSITIPDSVTNIGSSAFKGCSGLTSITFAENSKLTSIGDYAFHWCSSLTSIKIPKSVTSIGDYAFNQCVKLRSLNFELHSQLNDIGEYAFNQCALVDPNIPDTLTSIGAYAFSENNSLMSALLGASSITELPEGVFYHCYNLSSMSLPETLTSIGKAAFVSCKKLSEISIPSNVVTIGVSAFESCIALSTVNIRATALESIGSGAFGGCTAIRSVNIPNLGIWSNITFESSSSNPLGQSSNATLYANDTAGFATAVDKVELLEVKNYVFYRYLSLKEVIIKNNVSTIGKEAFTSCNNLETIYIPKSVTTIYKYAFSDISTDAKIYYGGSESDWANVYKDNYAIPSNVRIEYNATQPQSTY